MSPELLRPVERALNRQIAASGRARALLAELAGRSMELRWPRRAMTWSFESFQEAQVPLALPVDA